MAQSFKLRGGLAPPAAIDRMPKCAMRENLTRNRGPALWYIVSRYTIRPMIRSFRCADTEALFNRRRVKRFVNIESAARRKLNLVHAAGSPDFLRVPPGNRLEALRGNRAGQHSIRINDRFRVCFRWIGGHAEDVEIVDYH